MKYALSIMPPPPLSLSSLPLYSPLCLSFSLSFLCRLLLYSHSFLHGPSLPLLSVVAITEWWVAVVDSRTVVLGKCLFRKGASRPFKRRERRMEGEGTEVHCVVSRPRFPRPLLIVTVIVVVIYHGSVLSPCCAGEAVRQPHASCMDCILDYLAQWTKMEIDHLHGAIFVILLA